ncbi:hypothetical protein CB0940_10908 [Cercospora beticola]|uniref:Extracellular membrane protein CFEM domain-containing protein n=1 Tax=Cercospora beticola TaxID=122368 RepID=A0A2G5HDT8_CERBT|nr:hypothetical protein CB0940_10908 [Cercospora beticola]PIA90707.1 hypothetical protein CB0940_10908 [Cercospora beticola]WPB07752.1 hypothetical protein RHO25_012416 [Cercospora beticola]CAK1356438.1 unnamed protein product [Cercospora beticola]
MQFFTVAIIALFGLTANACKCSNDRLATESCCAQLQGNYLPDQQDCQAASISERLSTFASCCSEGGFDSDCDCPSGC